jgi:rhodanese-related sulfurtransferase
MLSFSRVIEMKRVIVILTGLAALLLVSTSLAYDAGLAEGFATLFEPVQGQKAGKALHLMKADQYLARVKAGEAMLTVDVRTPAEAAVLGMTLPDALAIPINRLFLPEGLAQIPTDRPVVVVCKSGTRATAAGTALRMIGFDNVFILKGGIGALAAHLSAITANPPPAPAEPPASGN